MVSCVVMNSYSKSKEKLFLATTVAVSLEFT